MYVQESLHGNLKMYPKLSYKFMCMYMLHMCVDANFLFSIQTDSDSRRSSLAPGTYSVC